MTNTSTFDILIIGGGLAGLSAAIHLSKSNFKVLVIEKNDYPKHKVCGEYISNEVLPYFEYLGVDVFKMGAKRINRFELSTPKNKLIKADLPLGGFGISRYTLDAAMAKRAVDSGAVILQDTVNEVAFIDDEFKITTNQNGVFKANITIGAFGKRSNLDIKLNRKFIQKKSPFLAVKIHVKGNFPEDLVALHNFEGGYCGVSKVEEDHINICYITDFEAFKKHKDIGTFQMEVMYKNLYLKTIFENSEAVFETPLTISQISFSQKEPIEEHMIMCGDSAGMIHPLCGNGMSMAIRSAQMASQLIIEYLHKKIASRDLLEQHYQKAWNAEFKNRLKTGHLVADLFGRKHLSEVLITGLKWIPGLLPLIIKRTHGKPMKLQ